MKKWVLFLVIFACALLQDTVLNSIRFFGVKPDLLLICVVIAALEFELKWALILSVSAGFFKDILAAQPFGFNLILFGLWSVLIIRLKRDISFDNPYLVVALMAVVALAHHLLVGLALVYLGNYIPLGIFVRIIIIETFYTALCLPLLKKVASL
ncbi:MAG: rod shape-determining protein MreD [Candidatus Omnitrophica bacterium]|nr:rod shape-determining protein MreD [Candidatus Omnitrophota bacterium]